MQEYSSIEPDPQSTEIARKWVRRFLNGLIVLGILFFAAAIVSYSLLWSNRNSRAKTEGTIVSFAPHGMPIVEYTVDGTAYRFIPGVISSSYHEGQTVQVTYPPASPEKGRLAIVTYVPQIILAALGAGFTAIPLLVKFIFRKVFEAIDARTEENAPVKL